MLARVGDTSIRRSAVDQRARAIERETHGATSGEDVRKRALNALILSYWVIGEAQARHLISSGAGADGSGLESQARAAARALQGILERGPSKLGRADVAAYYRSRLAHQEQFYLPERRLTDLIEGLPSRAAAAALRARIGTGAGFRAKAVRELVKRPPSFGEGLRMNNALLERIFGAKVGVIAAPVQYNGGWVLLVVRRILPGHSKPLASVRPEVLRLMTQARREEAAKQFVRDFAQRWSAKTSCSRGLVVGACVRYDGRGEPGESGLELPF